jgi:DNA-directed RNA polymerase specialized sigma24 family protein
MNRTNSTQAKDIMQKDVVKLDASMPIESAIRTLDELDISGAPVVDENGGLLGVLTTRDVTRVEHVHSGRIEATRGEWTMSEPPSEEIDGDSNENAILEKEDYSPALLGSDTAGRILRAPRSLHRAGVLPQSFGKGNAKVFRNPDQLVDLLRSWHAGDRAALDGLVERLCPLLLQRLMTRHGQTLRKLRRDLDPEDMVQIVLTEFLEYGPRFIPKDDPQLIALLETIAVNTTLDHLKSPRHRLREASHERHGDSVLDLRGCSRSSIMPDRAAEKAEERAWARLALEFIADSNDRRLVRLHVETGLSWNEIGADFETPPDIRTGAAVP